MSPSGALPKAPVFALATARDFWIGKLHRALDEMDNSRSNGVPALDVHGVPLGSAVWVRGVSGILGAALSSLAFLRHP